MSIGVRKQDNALAREQKTFCDMLPQCHRPVSDDTWLCYKRAPTVHGVAYILMQVLEHMTLNLPKSCRRCCCCLHPRSHLLPGRWVGSRSAGGCGRTWGRGRRPSICWDACHEVLDSSVGVVEGRAHGTHDLLGAEQGNGLCVMAAAGSQAKAWGRRAWLQRRRRMRRKRKDKRDVRATMRPWPVCAAGHDCDVKQLSGSSIFLCTMHLPSLLSRTDGTPHWRLTAPMHPCNRPDAGMPCMTCSALWGIPHNTPLICTSHAGQACSRHVLLPLPLTSSRGKPISQMLATADSRAPPETRPEAALV